MIEKINLYFTEEKHKNVFVLFALLALILRLLISFKGNNWDLGSWEIVSALTLKGQNIYANTERYNYGPIWCYILAALRSIGFGFAFFISLFLSIIDLLIAFILYKRKNYATALLFLFSPIAIIISGFHRQFDNMAVLFILCAVYYAETRDANKRDDNLSIKESIIFSAIISLSLITKHIFIFFPIWQFFRINGWKQKLIVLTLPVALFFVSFLPYLPAGFEGIMKNVFLYSSKDNAPLYYAFFNRIADMIFTPLNISTKYLPKILFFGMMILCGYFFRKKNLFDNFVFYLICIVLFSSAVACQYLVIPVLFTAVYPNFFSILYNVIVFLYFTVSYEELDLGMYSTGTVQKIIEEINFKNSYVLFALILFYNLIYVVYGKKIKEILISTKKK